MAIHLAGNSVLQIPASEIGAGATSFSACFWVNFQSIDNTDDALLQIGPDGQNRRLLIWRDYQSAFSSGTNCLSVAAGDGSTASTLSSVSGTLTSAVQGEWLHLAVTWQANFGFRLYINGLADPNEGFLGDSIASLSSGAEDYALGYPTGSFRRPDLWMAEHAFWANTVLTPKEIGVLAAGVSPLFLASRLAELQVYRALIRDSPDMAVGPTFAAVGSVPTVANPSIQFPSQAFTPTSRRHLVASVDQLQCGAIGAVATGLSLSGAAAADMSPLTKAS